MRYTESQEKELNARRVTFIQEVLFISDAAESTMKAAGWGTKGKEGWLSASVTRFRKDVRTILKDCIKLNTGG